MPGIKDVGVIGATVWPDISDGRRSLEEILYDLVQSTLKDAGLSADDIDGVVVAGNDQYDGRAISIMAASGSVGGVDRDILCTPSAGEHAFVMGALRIGSGQYRTQLIVAWSPTEAESLQEVQRLAADPYYHRRLPLDELSSHALQAAAIEHKLNARETVRALHAERPVRAGARNEADARWPLLSDMISPPTNGVAALLLASRDFVTERALAEPAWITGLGWATEPSYLGDRDLAALPSLERAAAKAYEMAGVIDPITDLDVAEIADTTPHQEFLARCALGLRLPTSAAERGAGPPINPSGGAKANNPVFCVGLNSIAETANQIRGAAGVHQIAGAQTGLAHAASGFAMQYNTVVVLGAQHQGRAL